MLTIAAACVTNASGRRFQQMRRTWEHRRLHCRQRFQLKERPVANVTSYPRAVNFVAVQGGFISCE